MREFFKKRWVLLVVLILFVVCKIPHLHYAYYWDECWPYAAAVKDMYKHGVSLLPTAIDPELSRGHPLFFHAAAAVWMDIFGTSHVSLHSFALLISLCFLVAIYEAGLRLFNQRVAVMAIILVTVQMIFFVQSSFVLLEMLTALLAFCSLYFYAKERHVLTAVFLSLLFYTKESGMVMGFVLGADALLHLASRKEELRTRLYRLISIALPFLLVAIFFVAQKHIRGWYIFPLHNEMIEHRWDQFWYRLRMGCMYTMFVSDLRYYYFLVLLLLSIVAAIKNSSAKYLGLLLPVVIIYYCVDDTRAGRIMPGIPFFLLFIASIVLMLFLLVRLRLFENAHQKRFTLLACIFVFCFLCFSSLTFFTPRYLLAAIVPVLFFAAVLFDGLIMRTYKWLMYPVIFAFFVIAFFSFKTNTGYGDCDLGAFDAMDVQQHVVNYFEQNKYYDKQIGCWFLNKEHLSDPATGFLHSDKAFAKAGWNINDSTDFAIFDDIENDTRYDGIKKDVRFHRVDRFEKGKVWAEIYERVR